MRSNNRSYAQELQVLRAVSIYTMNNNVDPDTAYSIVSKWTNERVDHYVDTNE